MSTQVPTFPMMACMCGDTHCSSCGPAQGNSQCELCEAWADDGCDHVDETSGSYKPEYMPEVERIRAIEQAAFVDAMEANDDGF